MKKLLRLVLWLAAALFFLTGWMLIEGGIFTQPIALIIKNSEIQCQKTGWILAGMALNVISIAIFLIPICLLVENIKRKPSS
jgi:hypothetical protein